MIIDISVDNQPTDSENEKSQLNELAFEDGGGGRIRTIEGSAGRFTVCSLWPLGNPPRGFMLSQAKLGMFSQHVFQVVLTAYKQYEKKYGGGGRIRTIEGSAGRFTVCSLWPLGNPPRGFMLSQAKLGMFSQHVFQVVLTAYKQYEKKYGGGGRIRTIEGSAGRFTVCSLWPLGNPPRGFIVS